MNTKDIADKDNDATQDAAGTRREAHTGSPKDASPGVHRLSAEEMTRHFADAPTVSEASASTVEVKLTLNKAVWQIASESAKRQGVSIQWYVEKAIESFQPKSET